MDDEILLDVLGHDVKLDELCWKCNQYGQRKDNPNFYGECDECNDTGFILTDVGKVLVNLVLRHTKTRAEREVGILVLPKGILK